MTANAQPAANPAATQASRPPKRARNANRTDLPPQEQRGAEYAEQLKHYLKQKDAKFLTDNEEKLSVYLDGTSISLLPTAENLDLCDLMLKVCRVSTMLVDARIAVQRLAVEARKQASRIQSRSFSAISKDGKRIYLPTPAKETLLQISEASIAEVPNGTNEDTFWLRHPKNNPFTFSEGDCQAALLEFERLLVESLSCKDHHLRWLVAMNEGLFPIVRDLCTARFILVHTGATQQGKTTAAKRFILLHGMGDVTGDGSVASLSNQGDVGFLALDNREQVNFKQPLIDYCLFVSTGGERMRSSNDGATIRSTNEHRPVVIITSIEGVFKAELEARCVEILFSINGQKVAPEGIQRQISGARGRMNSALARVLQRFLSIRKEQRLTPNTLPGFDEHFTALCDLLRAFGEVAGKPERWAEEIIGGWDQLLRDSSDDAEEDGLEFHIRQILFPLLPYPPVGVKEIDNVVVRGRRGKLAIVTEGAAHLLAELQRKPGLDLRLNPNGFVRRLSSTKFRSFSFLKSEDASEVVPEVKELKRTPTCKPIGFFFPHDVMTVNEDGSKAIVMEPSATKQAS